MTDELDLVRRFRADEPDAGEDTITVARAALTRPIASAPPAPRPPRRHYASRAWRGRGALLTATVAMGAHRVAVRLGRRVVGVPSAGGDIEPAGADRRERTVAGAPPRPVPLR